MSHHRTPFAVVSPITAAPCLRFQTLAAAEAAAADLNTRDAFYLARQWQQFCAICKTVGQEIGPATRRAFHYYAAEICE